MVNKKEGSKYKDSTQLEETKEIKKEIKLMKTGLILGGSTLPGMGILLLSTLSHPVHFETPGLGLFFGILTLFFAGLYVVWLILTAILLIVFITLWIKYKPKNLLTKEDWESLASGLFITFLCLIIAFLLPPSIPPDINTFIKVVMR
jgi:hypothetical protein